MVLVCFSYTTFIFHPETKDDPDQGEARVFMILLGGSYLVFDCWDGSPSSAAICLQ